MTNHELSRQASLLSRIIGNQTEETARQEVEKQLLEDDAYFEQMLAAESELIDAYAQGNLHRDQEESIGRLLGMSGSLRQSAEFSRQVEVWKQKISNRPKAKNRRYAWPLIFAGLLALVLSIFAISQARTNAQLQHQITGLEQQLVTAEARQRVLEQDLARALLLAQRVGGKQDQPR